MTVWYRSEKAQKIKAEDLGDLGVGRTHPYGYDCACVFVLRVCCDGVVILLRLCFDCVSRVF